MADNIEAINAEAALADKNSVFYTYQRLIQLRKEYDILTWGDYVDLLPDHPRLWCYCRRYENEVLVVATNFSGDTQVWHPPAYSGHWDVLISNYADTHVTPGRGDVKAVGSGLVVSEALTRGHQTGSKSAARSALVKLAGSLRSSSRIPPASSAFCCCSATIFSSMLPAAISL